MKTGLPAESYQGFEQSVTEKHKLPHGCAKSMACVLACEGGRRILFIVLAECKFRQEVPKMRVKITLACTECKQRNYNTKKNKKNDPDRLEMNKYCKFCKKHTLHKETK